MEFRTKVDIPVSDWKIEPCEEMLFVGSCFADRLGQRFLDEKFHATVNPFGVMYNPVSIGHTVDRIFSGQNIGTAVPRVAVFTLGTNHVYILKETGEIVDNCQKRPQRLFTEKELTVSECAESLRQTLDTLFVQNPDMHVILTVSPIRYRKYGYHGSQLSKAILQLAIEEVRQHFGTERVDYFPAYEIVLDELRDYRFYESDMLHPSSQAVEYIYEKFSETYFSSSTFQFLREWKPIRDALNHKPYHPESEEYKEFMNKTQLKVEALSKKYPTFAR